MVEKVKVSREVAEALDEIRGCLDVTVDHFIERHIKGNLEGRECCLVDLRTLFVAHLIYTGDYKIEQTPEEKLLTRFRYCEQRAGWHQDDEREMQATANAIKETLNTLNIEIEGINK